MFFSGFICHKCSYIQYSVFTETNNISERYFWINERSCGPSSQQYVSQQLTWSDAQNYCKVNCSGTLITVETEAMNNMLLNIYSPSSPWIGLRHEYDNWNWSNSDPVTYTNWKRTFSCAVLQSDGSWNDSDCNGFSFCPQRDAK
uniref:C-type lectin domain-containing protein n=1 Tax=Erpetoichthys calabaricus TaxID=27687 RepID=A0A8C4TJS6_ERPCA